MSRESLLDEAIVKAKECGDWQLVEWLRMARGGESAARWYTGKLAELQAESDKLVMKLNAEHIVRQNMERENAKLRELVRDMYACISHANEQDWFYFERDKFGCGMSCTVNGEACGLCALADRMRELGVQP